MRRNMRRLRTRPNSTSGRHGRQVELAVSRASVVTMKPTSDTLVMDFNGKVCATDAIGEEGHEAFMGSDAILNYGRTASEERDLHVTEGPVPMADIRVAAPKGKGPLVMP